MMLPNLDNGNSMVRKKPSLLQKMNILKTWFNLAKRKNPDAFEIDIEDVAEMLVEKGLVSDNDTGIKSLTRALNTHCHLQKLTFETF